VLRCVVLCRVYVLLFLHRSSFYYPLSSFHFVFIFHFPSSYFLLPFSLILLFFLFCLSIPLSLLCLFSLISLFFLIFFFFFFSYFLYFLDSFLFFTSSFLFLFFFFLFLKIFEKLKDVKSSKGYSLSNAIMTGVVTPHLGVGATAGDEECWELFKELYYPIIKEWHGYDAETQVQKRRKTVFRYILYF
jgi:ATP:guanido phosphotransferase, N-terminal domain